MLQREKGANSPRHGNDGFLSNLAGSAEAHDRALGKGMVGKTTSMSALIDP